MSDILEVPVEKEMSITVKVVIFLVVCGVIVGIGFGIAAAVKKNTAKTNCTLANWSEWSTCSATCGDGTTSRTKVVLTSAKNGGTCPEEDSPERKETKSCKLKECPQDCVLNDWSGWSACSATCGDGTQQRVKTVKVSEKDGGSCPSLDSSERKQVQSCKLRECPSHQLADKTNGFNPTGTFRYSPGSGFTEKDCWQQAHDGKFKAWAYRNENHPTAKNTCIMYTSISPYNGDATNTMERIGCVNIGEKLSYGCNFPPTTDDIPMEEAIRLFKVTGDRVDSNGKMFVYTGLDSLLQDPSYITKLYKNIYRFPQLTEGEIINGGVYLTANIIPRKNVTYNKDGDGKWFIQSIVNND